MKTRQAHTSCKVGRFLISSDLLDNYPYEVGKVLCDFTIIRAEYLFERRAICYTAYSEHFQECAIGDKPPWYKVSVKNNPAGFPEVLSVERYSQ